MSMLLALSCRPSDDASHPPRSAPGVTIDQASEQITAELLRKHVAFLAADELEGRGTPSVGLDRAAQYIAEQFAELGLEALTPDYFQPFTWKDHRIRNVIARHPRNCGVGSLVLRKPGRHIG